MCLPYGHVLLPAQRLAGQAAGGDDNPDARPPVTKADVRIVQRAREILNSQSEWNRADTRVCPADAKRFSLYCALEKATDEVSGKFEHRGAAMQEARFVIDEIAPNPEELQPPPEGLITTTPGPRSPTSKSSSGYCKTASPGGSEKNSRAIVSEP